MRIAGENTIVASIPGKNAKHFTYDKVLLETASQLDVFEGECVNHCPPAAKQNR